MVVALAMVFFLASCQFLRSPVSDKTIWAGYGAVAAKSTDPRFVPVGDAQQRYTIRRFDETTTVAGSFESIADCAPASLQTKTGQITGRTQLLDIVPRGGNAEPITLVFYQWEGTTEWWLGKSRKQVLLTVLPV